MQTGEFVLTPRKLLFHCLLHETRHWAQIALAVRRAGLEPPGNHDLFYSQGAEVNDHVRPVTLEGRGIRLEPLTDDHHDALAAAAADGRLWELWFISVPAPGGHAGLHRRRAEGAAATATCCRGSSATWRPAPSSARRAITTSSPRIDRVEIGYTWYAQSRQRTHVNTTCKLLLLAPRVRHAGLQGRRLRTDNFNFRSQRAIEALGAKKDGVLRHHARGATAPCATR